MLLWEFWHLRWSLDLSMSMDVWRYIVGTRDLDMTSFEPNDVSFGELILTLYVDASFSAGGGRSRTGIAMYLVNPIDCSESLVQWASRRQTSMATSAPSSLPMWRLSPILLQCSGRGGLGWRGGGCAGGGESPPNDTFRLRKGGPCVWAKTDRFGNFSCCAC